MLHISAIVLFKVIPIIFQAFQNHHGEQRTSEVSLKEIMHLKISAKFSYRADTDNRKNGHLLADTDMVYRYILNLSC